MLSCRSSLTKLIKSSIGNGISKNTLVNYNIINKNKNVSKMFYSTTSSNGEEQQQEKKEEKPKKKMNRLLFWGGLAVGGVTLFNLADLIINDDFDSITDKFRTRLPETEKANRPKVVILGTGWASLCFLRKLHTDKFDVTIVSPRNYFLFTPLLASTTTGTLEVRSIIEPIRKYCMRADAQEASFVEAECVSIDSKNKTIRCVDNSSVKGEVSEFDLKYDHLIVGIGADNQTFGIPGVKENSCFLKEINDSKVIRDKILDCLETASIPGQPEKEIDRLCRVLVVGGGPVGIEFTAELKDFLQSDLLKTYPLAKRLNITLVEALPHILNVFDKKIIDHVESRLQSSNNVKILTRTSVCGVKEKEITVRDLANKEEKQIPYGLLIWATGNAPRKITSQLIQSIGSTYQNNRRGLVVDEYFRVVGADGIWAIGDSCINPNKPLAQTAQVASQQGRYLGRLFNQISNELYEKSQSDHKPVIVQPNEQPVPQTLVSKVNETVEGKIKKQPIFKYHHLGTMAYLGDHQAVFQYTDDDEKSTTIFEGYFTYYLWRSVYFSKLLSLKNRVLVAFDWSKSTLFGRDVSRG